MNAIRTLQEIRRRGPGWRSPARASRIAPTSALPLVLSLALVAALSAAVPVPTRAQPMGQPAAVSVATLAPPPGAKAPVKVLGWGKATVQVQNDNWNDIHLYLVRNGVVTSLGFLTGPGEEEVALPPYATAPGSNIQFLVLPVGGLESYLTPAVVLDPGDTVDLVVANNLSLSTVVVSPKG